MIIVIYISTIMSIGLLTYGLIQINLLTIEQDSGVRAKTQVFLFEIVRPIILILAAYNQKLKIDSLREKYKKYLMISGNVLHINPDEFFAIKELSAIAGLIFGTFLFFSIDAKPIVPFVFLIFCFFLPNLSIYQTINKRKYLIFLDLPFQMDLLNLSVDAGLSFMHAIEQVVKKSHTGPLRDEFDKVLTELRLGRTPIDALNAMAIRTDMYEIRSFVSALIQAERLGTPIADTLKSQADMRRTERFQKAEKMAQEAPVKMLFPLIAFIFPAVFIIILTPIILKFIAEGI